MQEYAERFYKSQIWQETARAYKESVGGLCEKCLRRGVYRPAEIVHHKIHLTPANIQTPEISLCWDNLEALCRRCHGEEHSAPKRYKIDPETGRVILPPDSRGKVHF